ncbi:MAG: hypothetical protein IPK16_28265 [Anaerolineales bacterium]|nr:hypothetical protein [Anaerolineales bacterium]
MGTTALLALPPPMTFHVANVGDNADTSGGARACASADQETTYVFGGNEKGLIEEDEIYNASPAE